MIIIIIYYYTNWWVRVRMQISLIRAVDLRLRGSSRLKWTSSGFEDGAGLPFLRQ